MKFPSNRIEGVAVQDSRYSNHMVQFDVEAKKLIATDGHMLAAVPVEVAPEDHTGLITQDAIKAIREITRREKSSPTVAVNGKVTVTGRDTHAEYAVGQGSFPDWQKVVAECPVQGEPTITFDVNLLIRLVDGLRSEPAKKNGTRRVSLWIQAPEKPIIVKSIEDGDDGSIGLLMPVRPPEPKKS